MVVCKQTTAIVIVIKGPRFRNTFAQKNHTSASGTQYWDLRVKRAFRTLRVLSFHWKLPALPKDRGIRVGSSYHTKLWDTVVLRKWGLHPGIISGSFDGGDWPTESDQAGAAVAPGGELPYDSYDS